MALRPTLKLTQPQGHRLVTAPAAEPVTLEAVRTLLREPPTAENDFITSCITQARILFEGTTGIACINQTWKLTLNNWPGGSSVEFPLSLAEMRPQDLSLSHLMWMR